MILCCISKELDQVRFLNINSDAAMFGGAKVLGQGHE